MCLNKTHLKNSRIFKNTLSFIYCNKIENFWIFPVVNFKEFLLFEGVGSFRGFRLFDFSPYTEIENSENSETFSRLVIVLLEEVGNFRGSPVFDFAPYAEIENSEHSEFFSRLVKLSEFVLF